MNAGDVLRAMLPEHLVLVGLLGVVVLEIAGHGRRAVRGFALPLVAVAVLAALGLAQQQVTLAPFAGHFSIDPPTALAKAVVFALALPVLLMADDEFEGGEVAALLLSSLYGIGLLLSADSVLTLFLGLETMSLPLYALVLLRYRGPRNAEAALKYLVLGGAASAMFLMGASLLYGSTGSLATAGFAKAFAAGVGPIERTAVVLVMLAFFLKAAIVPFHGWAPDAYEGASVPVTAFMAVLVKAGVLLAVVRLIGHATLSAPLLQLVALLPLASIVWGNLAAMRQGSLRRMIAYSSIAHAGYLFYALLGEPATRWQAVTFYVAAYGLLNLLALAALPGAEDDVARDRLDTLRGLFHRSPYAALMIGLAMLSLAGIPPLPGFVAKFLIFRNVVAAGHVEWAVAGLVGSYLGIYFYLRVIQLMFMSPAASPGPRAAGVVLSPAAMVASLACLAGTLLLAVVPGALMARL